MFALFLFVDFMDVDFTVWVGDFYAVFFKLVPKGEQDSASDIGEAVMGVFDPEP